MDRRVPIQAACQQRLDTLVRNTFTEPMVFSSSDLILREGAPGDRAIGIRDMSEEEVFQSVADYVNRLMAERANVVWVRVKALPHLLASDYHLVVAVRSDELSHIDNGAGPPIDHLLDRRVRHANCSGQRVHSDVGATHAVILEVRKWSIARVAAWASGYQLFASARPQLVPRQQHRNVAPGHKVQRRAFFAAANERGGVFAVG